MTEAMGARHATHRARRSWVRASLLTVSAVVGTGCDSSFDGRTASSSVEATDASGSPDIGDVGGSVSLRSAFSEGSTRFADASWSPDGQLLALGDADGRVRVLDRTGSLVADPYSAGFDSVTNLEWSRSGTMLASGVPGGDIRVRYGWTEEAACALVREVFDAAEIERIVDLESYIPRCLSGQMKSFPVIPSMSAVPSLSGA